MVYDISVLGGEVCYRFYSLEVRGPNRGGLGRQGGEAYARQPLLSFLSFLSFLSSPTDN